MAFSFERQAGQDFFVNHERFVVTEVEAPGCGKIKRERDGMIFSISRDMEAEIVPGIKARAGLRETSTLLKLDVDAPDEVWVSRGEKYREKPPTGPRPTRR